MNLSGLLVLLSVIGWMSKVGDSRKPEWKNIRGRFSVSRKFRHDDFGHQLSGMCYVSEEEICFMNKKEDKELVIPRVTPVPSVSPTEISYEIKDSSSSTSRHRTRNDDVKRFPFDGIFGVYHFPSGPFIAIITGSRLIYHQEDLGLDYRQITRIDILPVYSHHPNNTWIGNMGPEEIREQLRRIDLLKLAIKSHDFYFSPNWDVGMTLQRLFDDNQSFWKKKFSFKTSDPLRELCVPPTDERHDDRFFWNKGILKPFLKDTKQWKDLESFIHPVMNAFMRISDHSYVETDDHADGRITLILISRRSRHRQGTRFTVRGIDMEGNVANFAETEQIAIFHNGVVSSHVQIRGSLPLFWKSPANLQYRPPISIEDDLYQQSDALKRHCLILKASYLRNGLLDRQGLGRIIFCNLIDKKKDQGRLGDYFQSVFEHVRRDIGNGDSFRLLWFDFHHETRRMKYENLLKLIKELEHDLNNEGYLRLNISRVQEGQDVVVDRIQRGIVRTNCMDCLDRTNVVQSLLARRTLLQQLGDQFEIKMIKDLSKYYSSENSTLLFPLPGSDLEQQFRLMWSENADAMSMLYAGSDALKRDYTRKGKRTKTGAFEDLKNSALRYLMNNFADYRRQDSVDFLLGKYQFEWVQRDAAALDNWDTDRRYGLDEIDWKRHVDPTDFVVLVSYLLTSYTAYEKKEVILPRLVMAVVVPLVIAHYFPRPSTSTSSRFENDQDNRTNSTRRRQEQEESTNRR